MKTCPFFGKCGGCAFDFTADDYREKKLKVLNAPDLTGAPVWIEPGTRRRTEFCFAPGQFGLYAPHSKDIVPITHCPGIVPEINQVLPAIAALPFAATGSALITKCDNGIDMAITSDIPYFGPEFKRAVEQLPLIRVTWNKTVIMQRANPIISFGDHPTPYPSGVFLQPSIPSADIMRDLVVRHAAGARRVADLFCGLGNFTFALNADGFDISGTGMKRDLFNKPLPGRMLNQYDCVIMDPPRAGAMAQCRELITSQVPRIIYISCNPDTFARDRRILTHGGYRITQLIPIDQFIGSTHWELFSVFEK